jgi:hypothetical protein
MLVVGGSMGIRIREKCKSVARSILLKKKEVAWLIKSLDGLVTGQDSKGDLEKVGNALGWNFV